MRVVERALDQERHGVDAEARQALLQPEAHDLRQLVADLRVGQVEIRLVRIELVQVVLAGLAVIGPVRGLLVGEDDVAGLLGRALVGPDVEVAVRRVRARARRLEPRVLIGGVVHDEVRDHADPAVAAGPDQLREVAERAQRGIDGVEVGDVVAVVAVRRGVERHQPQAADPEPGEVVDALGEPGEVAAAVAVVVVEHLDVEAVEDGVLPPQVAGGLDPHASAGRTCSPKASMKASRSWPTWWMAMSSKPERRVLLQPGDVLREVGGDQHLRGDVLGPYELRGDVEGLGRVEVPADRRVEDVRAPLVVGDGQRLLVGRRPAHVHLQHLAPFRPERVEQTLERLDRRVDRRQPVGPLRAPGRGLLAHRRAQQRRRYRRQRPQPRAVDHHVPVVRDLLAAEERAHDVHALAQARRAVLLRRPALAGDVLVGRLAGAQRDPQAFGEHLAQRRRGLGDDRRVIALPGRVDHPERQRGLGQRGAEEGPGEAGLALPHAPRREVIGRHAGGEAGLLRAPDGAQQLARWDLLVRAVQGDTRHEAPSTRPAPLRSR